jgi:hypothetical protein
MRRFATKPDGGPIVGCLTVNATSRDRAAVFGSPTTATKQTFNYAIDIHTATKSSLGYSRHQSKSATSMSKLPLGEKVEQLEQLRNC